MVMLSGLLLFDDTISTAPVVIYTAVYVLESRMGGDLQKDKRSVLYQQIQHIRSRSLQR